ncbi:neuronal calcium sensor 2 isoform X1 [Phymastichus coffea]|uniref:neuronal calcium sensor 2 isoform X1 n=1 Tax=Phymastichus coffea TaxID=108790 RepID=UPI00273ABD48|nr:neuronal calcium sensor 2 isoform X1 [Phymastichus coffea]XP_058797440.1 neuronal calcium sensor 2 isoform X1 [Phymastichus coffea]XP_058797441.1 neuronal calcium sensor 2 isoform X1 [Phymastichus coffea]XP_058797442.1 neuronal calcium sensor 2 isoform X1 [Phymastichus coffea]
MRKYEWAEEPKRIDNSEGINQRWLRVSHRWIKEATQGNIKAPTVAIPAHTHTHTKMGCFGSKDKLSKEDMDFLKSHTRYDEATIKEWYKGFKQDCPNGRLTPAKFVDMYKMFFPSGNAEEFCDHVFRTFDMDKNGYIDFKEFLLAIDVTSSGTPEEKLKWAFRMYDVDGNGVIDIGEMTKIVQAIYDMLGACSSNRPADSAEERAKNIFAKMDENNDGQLTQDEFLKGCLQDEELSKMLAP